MIEQDKTPAELIIITGVSGGGKSSALRTLEDYGYFCVDNFIPALLIPFVKLISPQFEKIAVVIDSRGGSFFSDLSKELQSLKELGINYRIVFFDATDETLVHRFSETRRRHPLINEKSALLDSITYEKTLLEDIRVYADEIIDSSNLSINELRKRVIKTVVDQELQKASMRISIMSFGYKYGLPVDADLVFDVRFLPNPHYIPELKPKTGLDNDVQEYVLEKDETKVFLNKLYEFVNFLIPQYKSEGKSLLTVAIGCTGGRHRSVAIANQLREELSSHGYYVANRHRDIKRNHSYYNAITKTED